MGVTKTNDSSTGASKFSTAFTENTLLSFLVAARLGAKYIEFDVQLSRDWVPIIVHDEEITIKTSASDDTEVLLRVPVNKLNHEDITRLKALIVRDAYLTKTKSPRLKERHIKRSASEPYLTMAEQASSAFKITYHADKPVPRSVWDILSTYPSLKQTFQYVDKDVGFNIGKQYG